jgi:serine/threonine protein kinase
LESFRREHTILKGLLGVHRCLQLTSGLNPYDVHIPTGGTYVVVPCQYFAVEWIDEDIDKYFLQQDRFTPMERLRVFHAIVSSIQSLHENQVFHRDIKMDNLRQVTRNGQRQIIAIDLGTAARFASAPIQTEYVQQVGAPIYASLEALCGLAGNRIVAPRTDPYAIGCLLFELFNKDYYFHKLLARNPNFRLLYAALRTQVNPLATDIDQAKDWGKALDKT